MSFIDPTLYGGKPAEQEFTPVLPAAGAGVDVQVAPLNPVPLDEAMRNLPEAVQGAAARAAASRAPESVGMSIGATVATWDTTRLLKNLTAPDFVPQEYDRVAMAKQLDFMPSTDEIEWLNKSNSPDEYLYRTNVVKQQRDAAMVAGDNPMTSFLFQTADPLYWLSTPAAAMGAKTLKAGRVAAAVAGGGVNMAIQAGGEGPTDTTSLLLNGLLSGAVSAMAYKGGKLVQHDPDFPAQELHLKASEVDAALSSRSTVPSQVALTPAQVVQQVDTHIASNAGIGEKLQWNMRKTMSDFGPTGRKIADLLFDNNSDLGHVSVEAHQWAVRGELKTLQLQWEDALREEMSAQGFGMLQRMNPMRVREAARAQERIEREVQLEMFRREQLARQGLPITYDNVRPAVKKMADALDATHARALQELKAAGVEGAEDVLSVAGWHHRKWSAARIDEMTTAFKRAGLSDTAAHQQVVKLVSTAVRRANNMPQDVAYDVSAAIVNRAIRKGYFEDALFKVPQGEGQLKQFRDLLKSEGITGQRLERVLDVFRQNTDDAGKAGFMKHRMDLDYKASVFVNGQQYRVIDLLDSNLTGTVDQYLDGVSSQVAFARKGLRKPSDIDDLRSELARSLPVGSKKADEAIKLFDNVVAFMRGQPAGENVPDAFRMLGQYGRMISLANSGLWQVTEYATMMGQYGVLKTLKYAIKEAPGFRTLLGDMRSNSSTARSVKDVLTAHSENNLRIRPYIRRFEDNFEFGLDDSAQLIAQQMGQLVPYANAMKYVHSHQARIAANLIVDRIANAAKGSADEIAALQKYGVSRQVMDKVRAQVRQHGFNVDSWDDAVWAEARPAFARMMDEAVLHSRLGDMPAFAKFSQVGKFMFAYRSFVLTAHNKVLMGGIERNGAGATALLIAYQAPLAAMAVQAQAVIQGKEIKDEKEWAAKTLGVMGALGFGSEIAGILTGQKNQWGSPGLIPIDRGIATIGSAVAGNTDKAISNAANLIPILPLLPGYKAMVNLGVDK